MSAIPFLNVALHALLISVLGWALVKWCVRDARHRAWAALLAVFITVVAPALMELPRHPDAPSDTAVPYVAATASWKPDWKVPAPTVMRASLPAVPAVAPAAASPWGIGDLAWWTAAVWLTGSLLLSLRHTGLCLAAWRWRRSLRAMREEEFHRVGTTAAHAGMGVFESDGCPCVTGLLRPVIAVPASILRDWTPQQWRWLLRHEREHLRGHDTRIAWCLGWVKALLWWNPFIHALVEQWTQAREEICDMAAVAHDQDPAAYSGFLLDIVASTRLTSPALLHMAASKPARRLKARMVAMLGLQRVRERVSPAFLVAALSIMAAGSVLVSCLGVKEDAPPAEEESTELLTRVFNVPTDFIFDRETPLDPFADPARGDTPMVKKTAKTLLTERGIRFPEGASAVFNASSSQLIVKNTASNLDHIAMELEAMRGEREVHQTQVYVTTKWVEIDTTVKDTGMTVDFNALKLGKTNGDRTILTDPEFQVVIRALSQRKGVDLMVAPSVTTRIGQKATIEVVREVILKQPATAADKGTPTFALDFVGVRNELLVQFAEDRLKLYVHADLGEFEGADSPGLAKFEFKGPVDGKVLHLRKSSVAMLPDGHTLMLNMGHTPRNPHRTVLLFVTAALIDPSGQTLDPADAVQRARRAEMLKKEAEKASPDKGKKPEGKPVTLEVKTMDLRTAKQEDWLKAISDAIPMPPGAAKPEAAEPQNAATTLAAPLLAPGVFTLAGVMTPDQCTAALRALEKRGDAKLVSYPVMTTPSTKAATVSSKSVLADKALDGFSMIVTPVTGADGHTIDLTIAATDHTGGRRTGPITTAVTLWDGQTVVLGGLVGEDEKGWLSRLIFISAKVAK